nr:MAG TPA: LcrG protein [Caudoviricetes sp.]
MNYRETIYEHEDERLSELWERLGLSPAAKGSTQIEREKTESQLNAEIERIKEILAKEGKGNERKDKNCIEKEAV